VLVTGPGPY
jgi:NAD(P)-dependent dehydrogenase (short-subunit alcohol dehydrogenase family)